MFNGPPLSEGKSYSLEYRIVRKDKTICWVEGRFKPVIENGAAVRIDGFISDISKRKEAELMLEQKLEELNTFTYKASHDLRSPLISLRGLVKIALSESKDPVINKYLAMIGESTVKMEANLQELIAVALSKQGELKKSEINFSELLNEILESIKFLPGFDRVNITTEINVSTPFYSDRQSLHSILFNLVSNCIKYRNVNINSHVKIKIEEDQKNLRIIISDNGIGILPEYKEKVFEMFYRATENSTGSGLGLYIVATTLEKLKGKIELKSQYGEGCDFIIHLPLA
jgi:signal transduction histidine kinase